MLSGASPRWMAGTWIHTIIQLEGQLLKIYVQIKNKLQNNIIQHHPGHTLLNIMSVHQPL